jgi:hypothetical protein
MMQLARRASLVVVLLLASVGTASAECAWVLWSVIDGKRDSWLPFDSYDRLAECKRKEQDFYAIKGRPQNVKWVCLPGTLNPTASNPRFGLE